MEKLDSRERIELSAPVDEISECSLVVTGDQTEAVDATATNAAAVQTFAELGLPLRYRVVELLGEGGMAHVYKALDTNNGGKSVAVKILRPEIVPDPSIVERFFREAKASQQLAHPNLVSVFDFGTTENQMPYLIMEYVDGRNLAQIIADEGQVSGDRSVGIFLQIANGLKDAHRLGVVHRDLKPSNILIATKDDGTDLVKITDFGIAKPASSERSINPDLTKTGAILGSPAYMSPEQCLGHVVDERSDIYSLGCLMYETLTGRSPFASDTPVKSMIRHLEDKAEPFEIEFSHLNIQKGLESAVLRCLEKKPADRFQRIEQLSDALVRPSDTGVGRRFLAEALDLILLFLIAAPCQLIVTASLSPSTSPGFTMFASTRFLDCLFVYALFLILYYTGFESSKLQATPGKLVCGLRVSNEDGTRPTLASNFFAATTVATLIYAIGQAAAFCTLCCFVVPYHSLMLFNFAIEAFSLISFLVVAPAVSNNGRRNMFDLLFDRQVTPPVIAKALRGRTAIKHVLIGVAMAVLFLPVTMGFDMKRTSSLPFMHNIVCTKSWVNKGEVITKEMLQVAKAPSFFIPEGAISEADQVIGKRVSKRIPPLWAFKPSMFTDLTGSSQPQKSGDQSVP
jgi:serine/threonine protein kinase